MARKYVLYVQSPSSTDQVNINEPRAVNDPDQQFRETYAPQPGLVIRVIA